MNELGAQAVTTPGALRVFADAHAALGRKPWSALFDGADRLRARRAGSSARMSTPCSRWTRASGAASPTAEKLAHTEDGRGSTAAPTARRSGLGERVRNPDLAATLRAIAAAAPRNTTRASIARRIVDAVQAGGGLLIARGPDRLPHGAVASRCACPIAASRVCLPEPPAGGVVVGEMLRILDRFDLTALGHNSAGYIRLVIEAMKIAGIDKEAHVGDPAFQDVPRRAAAVRRLCR